MGNQAGQLSRATKGQQANSVGWMVTKAHLIERKLLQLGRGEKAPITRTTKNAQPQPFTTKLFSLLSEGSSHLKDLP
jgi:hypothetical protein